MTQEVKQSTAASLEPGTNLSLFAVGLNSFCHYANVPSVTLASPSDSSPLVADLVFLCNLHRATPSHTAQPRKDQLSPSFPLYYLCKQHPRKKGPCTVAFHSLVGHAHSLSQSVPPRGVCFLSITE